MCKLVLMLDTEDLAKLLAARLTAKDRAVLAFTALQSLDRDEAEMTAEAALFDGAGMPIASLFNYMDEAAFWTDRANPREIEAYGLACFRAMPPSRQAAFLNFVQGSMV